MVLKQNTMVRKVIGMHSETCPEIVLDVNNKLMVQFIWKHIHEHHDAEVDHDIDQNKHLLKPLFDETGEPILHSNK